MAASQVPNARDINNCHLTTNHLLILKARKALRAKYGKGSVPLSLKMKSLVIQRITCGFLKCVWGTKILDRRRGGVGGL